MLGESVVEGAFVSGGGTGGRMMLRASIAVNAAASKTEISNMTTNNAERRLFDLNSDMKTSKKVFCLRAKTPQKDTNLLYHFAA